MLENDSINGFQEWVGNLISGTGVAADWIPALVTVVMLIILITLSWLSLILTRNLLISGLHKVFLKTATRWDDILIEHRVLYNLSHLVPAFLIKLFAPVIFAGYDEFLVFILKLSDVYIIITITRVAISFLKGIEGNLSITPVFKDKPIASYFQLARMILYIASGIIVLSVLMGKSPIYFLSAFGAMTAILLLIFKDTILGLVASVQISSNDMVRVGDWVEMPKYNADGDVIAINLNTVKIRNFDKTVTTIPTYYFITDSFKNWRGMEESGGRRIKRSINVNIRSVKFVDQTMRQRFEKFLLINQYVSKRQQEIELFNQENAVDTTELINGRRMTNIGVFRNYAVAYLRNHPKIRKDLTILVRQLSPSETGLPIEIYCFTATTAWLEYEDIQSDIFDHLLAAAESFDLEVFQSPSGSDIISAAGKFSAR